MTPEEIKEILKNSGYLFEQKAASVIAELDFNVVTNKAYQDVEKGISREMDIVAHKPIFSIDKFNTKGICYLVCECKGGNQPLVFFTRPKFLLDKLYRPNEFVFAYNSYFKKGENNETITLDPFTYLGLGEDHYYTRSDIKAVQFCKIIKNDKKIEAQESGVMRDLLFPVIKAYLSNSKYAPTSNNVEKYCTLFFNLVIVNSELYTIDTSDENALPVKVNYVPFVREIQSESINGNFLVTFVTFDYLKEFIQKEVLSFCEAVRDKYNSDDKYLLGYTLGDIF